MAQFVTLKASGLTALREMDPRLVSYNVLIQVHCRYLGKHRLSRTKT